MTARWQYLSAADPCNIPIGRGQTCSKPGDHLDGCDWPLPRCRCSHGPSTHTGGYGKCHSLSCACGEYRDPIPPPPPLELVTCADLLTSCTHTGPHVPVGLDGKPAATKANPTDKDAS